MKLLVLTQKVDLDDAVLGFFHKWLEKMATRCDSVTVICLSRGRYDLPTNVKVLSLGKESGENKLKYLTIFFYYIWSERRNYDKVFVHMNPEYLVLGGWLWLSLRKPAYLWFNHKYGSWIARLGQIFAIKIFYTSPHSFFSTNSKASVMPVGIDIDAFNNSDKKERKNDFLLCLGRISPVKNVEILIEAMKIVDRQGFNCQLDIVGSALSRDLDYFNNLKESAAVLMAADKINFQAEIPNYRTPAVYRRHDFFINLTNSGSLDKAILEAMACGCLPIVSNTSLLQVLPSELLFKERDSLDLANKIFSVRSWPSEKRESLRASLISYIQNNHSLDLLIDKIFFYLNS
jgi:glycosyltransferase involved in cell wall biosynthesis